MVMRTFAMIFLRPLNLAGIVTWATLPLSLRSHGSPLLPVALPLLLTYLAAFVASDVSARSRARASLHVLQGVCALAFVWHTAEPRGAVLLVVLAAQLALGWSPRAMVMAMFASDVALWAILDRIGHPSPFISTVTYAGFQAFAALVSHFARTAQAARDELTLRNADLLATRALVADSARDAERVRVARDLHDVAGHKLTAMLLNLRALDSDPAIASRHELRCALQLAVELMQDIRGVVAELRRFQGLDLATALHALAAPLPRPSLSLSMGEGIRITDAAVAETLLRTTQEALTNAARHADATVLHVDLRLEGDRLRCVIEDDGRLQTPFREGHGLSGMRERAEANGGSLTLCESAAGTLRICVDLPA